MRSAWLHGVGQRLGARELVDLAHDPLPELRDELCPCVVHYRALAIASSSPVGACRRGSRVAARTTQRGHVYRNEVRLTPKQVERWWRRNRAASQSKLNVRERVGPLFD